MAEEQLYDHHRAAILPELAEKLDHVYYSATERPKARFALALLAVMRLGSENAKYSRREIFSPFGNPKRKESKALTDEGLSKDWQRKFIERLLKDGHINITGSYISAPEPEQKEALSKIVMNALDADGLLLKALLWPSQYQVDAPENPFDDPTDKPFEMEAPSGRKVEASAEFEILKELGDRLEGFQTYLGQIVAHLDNIYKGLEDLPKITRSLETVQVAMELAAESQESSRKKLEEVVSAIQDETRVKIASIAERVQENKERRKTILSQMHSEANREDKLLQELEQAVEYLKGQRQTRTAP